MFNKLPHKNDSNNSELSKISIKYYIENTRNRKNSRKYIDIAIFVFTNGRMYISLISN